MADQPADVTLGFFQVFLPNKLAKKPELQASIKDSIMFEITKFDGETSRSWTLDLRTPPGAVIDGAIENPGCTLSISKADWEAMLASPAKGMQFFMSGKLKVKGKQGLAMQLQKILA